MINVINKPKKEPLISKDLQPGKLYRATKSVGSSINVGDIVFFSRFHPNGIATVINTGVSYTLSASTEYEEISAELIIKE